MPAERRNKTLRFDLVDTCRAYVDHLNERLSAKTDDEMSLDAQKLQAEVDYRRAKAKQAQLQLDELEGTLHRSVDVRDQVDGIVYSIRSALMAMPGRLAMEIVKVTDRNEASQLVKREVYRVLEELSRHAYDPKWYAERVRDRKGWDEEE